MASSGRGSHLAAVAAGREVVFCHECQHEWYRDERESLTCPRCDSEFTQIAESLGDLLDMRGIRTPSDFSSRSGLSLRRPGGGADSDLDEDDILEHLRNEPWPRLGRPELRSRTPSDRERAFPDDGDAVLRRFADMLVNDLGAGRALRGNFPAGGLFPPDEQALPPGTRVQQRTFRAGPFGGTHTRVTITSGTIGGGPEGPAPNFGTLFSQLFGNPWPADEPERRGLGGPEPGHAFVGGLHDLLNSLYNPAAAVHGDAVFTQEALDRIITQLMEASPQTNAAPPATQAAIDRLEKKRVDAEMLGPEGKAECTICIDEIHLGDEVLVLPCKHWYHGECVVLWLKEHNTCPICRMPIEGREGSSNSNGNPSAGNRRRQSQQQPQQPQQAQPSSSASASASTSSDPFAFANPFSSRAARERDRDRDRDRDREPRQRTLRSARENLDRLNSIRNLAGAAYDFDVPADNNRHPSRRNSHSPPGAWPSSDTEGAARAARVRSPSASSRDRIRDRDRDRERERVRERERLREGGDWWQSELEWMSDDFWGGGRRTASAREAREQQEHGSGGASGGGGGPLGWWRDHFGRRG